MYNFRQWLTHLSETDRLAVFKEGIDLKFDLLGQLERYEGSKACYFPSPKGYTIPVVGGSLGQRGWAADALGIASEGLLERVKQALHAPIPWQVVDQDKAPIHEVVIDKDIDLKKILPVITHHEKDAGPYITSGLVHGLNIETGKQNTSINRLQVHGPNKLGILMLPRDLYAYYNVAESMDKPLPVTITIGNDPITKLASQAIAARDQSELEIAGAMMGKALPVVKSYSNDVYIPAESEIAIEGHILPHVRGLEGPFGEFPKYYSGAGMLPVIEISCITHRHNPIYEVNNPSGLENVVLGGVPREASLLERIQVNFPNVIDLRLTPGGLGRYHIVIKMKKKQMGEGKNVLACAFGCHYDIKLATVVDDDIDIDDPMQIEWAVATRFQADRDLIVINRALGSKLDPSTKKRGLSSKVGMDATSYVDEPAEFYVSQIPQSSALYEVDALDSNLNLFKKYIKDKS